jgi:hypothetical protein
MKVRTVNHIYNAIGVKELVHLKKWEVRTVFSPPTKLTFGEVCKEGEECINSDTKLPMGYRQKNGK